MKQIYLLLISLLTVFAIKAQVPNYVIVRGTVVNGNGAAVNNWPVYIIPDTTSAVSCTQKQTVYTNPNGFYQDTLFCTNPLSIVYVYTMNCNNTSLIKTLQVPPSKVVEANFTLCNPSSVTCAANFSFNVTGNTVFFSNTSTVSSGNVISQNNWSFGDGTSSNQSSVSHTYANPGVYTVMLSILSSGGCKDSIIKTIFIQQTKNCKANFFDSIINNTAYFFSSGSTVNSNDYIVERIWNFGDANSSSNVLTGNVMNPSHTYAANGNYNVCLKTVSYLGCIDTICKTISISNTPPSCTSNFIITTSGLNASYNSSSSQAFPGTTITRRTWYFGDGDTLGGNVISPTHSYTSSGTYQVCLAIFTSSGCQNYVCKAINIVGQNTQCLAAFTTSVVSTSPYTVSFNSSNSQASAGDSITGRFWTFGDGTSGSGKIVNHAYTTAGNYTVCLVIVSSRGCRDTTCTVVQVPVSGCQAYFTMSPSTTNNQLINFNSSSSSPSNIISRVWSFGDGDSLSGNVISPQHTYATAGSYTVCLKIQTSNGCQNSICKVITIAGKPCKAKFTAANGITLPPGIPMQFNSSASETAIGDSITSRLWYFGDNNYVSGNVVSPVHIYTTTGIYTVCLSINTASGCFDSTCQQVQVPLLNTPICNAVFTATPSITNSYQYSFNSMNSSSVPASQIISRTWTFGDGDTLKGNVVNPQHVYSSAGNYVVCLKIVSANGCEKTTCQTISIKPTHCQSKFTVSVGAGTPNGYAAYFYSTTAYPSAGDSISQRFWSFGDGSGLTTGNIVSPVHTYTNAGNYTACLYIRTYKGCTDSFCMQVSVPSQTCKAEFSYISSGGIVRFLGNYSSSTFADTIISRVWSFGDGSSVTTGNVVNPIHTYTQSGTYQVCLVIKTSKGCQSTICKSIRVTTAPVNCTPLFTYNQVPNLPLTLRFISSSSAISNQDSIVSRVWNFGDGTSLFTGNVVNPIKNYLVDGPYIVCLKITTRLGCQNEVCQTVRAGDTTKVIDTTKPFRIISLTPNPVSTSFTTVVWSKYQNVNAEYAIFDIYGVKKWSQNRVLSQSNNVLTVPAYNLLPGPYFLRVTTVYGTDSRKFYKL